MPEIEQSPLKVNTPRERPPSHKWDITKPDEKLRTELERGVMDTLVGFISSRVVGLVLYEGSDNLIGETLTLRASDECNVWIYEKHFKVTNIFKKKTKLFS